MSEPVTQGQFFEAIKQLREDSQESHKRLRETIDRGFDKLSARADLHEKEDRIVADRVLVIETQRAGEAKASVKRGMWAGVVVSVGLNGLIQAFKMMVGR